jgi:hypothetical protein
MTTEQPKRMRVIFTGEKITTTKCTVRKNGVLCSQSGEYRIHWVKGIADSLACTKHTAELRTVARELIATIRTERKTTE